MSSRKRSDNQFVRTEPSVKQWRALYEVAGNLKWMAPWRALSAADTLVLCLPGQKEPVFCSVMGQAAMNYGIVVCPGYESLVRFDRMIRRDAHSAEMIALEQDCLCCYFGDREDVKEADCAVMEQLGLQFRGRNQWIFFRALKPGRSPWFLNAEQAELMISALQNLFMLCRLLMEGRFRPDFDAGETMIRWFDSQKNLWLNDVVRMRKPKLERRLTFADGSELDGLKQREKTAVRLEIDSFYFPVQVRESKNDPPVSPYEALLVDRRSGLILDQRFAKPGEPEHMVAISALLNYVHQYGRPSIVYVRSNWVGALVRSTCEELGIRLIDNKGVPVLDGVLDTMLSRSRQ